MGIISIGSNISKSGLKNVREGLEYVKRKNTRRKKQVSKISTHDYGKPKKDYRGMDTPDYMK